MIMGSSDDNMVLGAELLAAARHGRGGTEVIRILEGDPTLIHVVDPVGDTTLHVAARVGNLEVAELVVGFVKKHGLTEVLMEQNVQGDTPLHVVLTNRREHLARLLYQAEPRAASLLNADGVSPWTLAREAGFDLYNSHDDERGRPPVGIFKAPLLDIEMELVYRALGDRDSLASTQNLTSRSYQSNVNNADKHYLFLEAILDGREDLVLELLRKHPDLIRHKDPRWGTALHRPADIGQVRMLRLLVGELTPEEAASMMLEGNLMDNTPLHLALEGYHKDAARYLIDFAPMAAYQVNKKGVSPLYWAVERGYEDIVKYVFLLMPVAAISPATRESLLMAKKASLGHAAIKVRNLGILESLMEELPELINAVDHKGWRVLSYAAYKGYLDGVRYLLINFPNSVKEYDRDGSLPMHKAIGGGHVNIVKEFLLNCPETLYDTDKKGQNILHFAVKYTKADILTYLTNEITEVKKIFYFKDNEGKTAIDLAKELRR